MRQNPVPWHQGLTTRSVASKRVVCFCVLVYVILDWAHLLSDKPCAENVFLNLPEYQGYISWWLVNKNKLNAPSFIALASCQKCVPASHPGIGSRSIVTLTGISSYWKWLSERERSFIAAVWLIAGSLYVRRKIWEMGNSERLLILCLMWKFDRRRVWLTKFTGNSNNLLW